jgi:biopolymer transport protein ExbD
VLENGRIRLDSVEMSDEEFLRTMPIAMRGQPSNYIRFDADDSANYGRTVEVMDLARRAGVVDIAVITDRMRGRAAAPTVPSGSEAIPTSIAPTR